MNQFLCKNKIQFIVQQAFIRDEAQGIQILVAVSQMSVSFGPYGSLFAGTAISSSNHRKNNLTISSILAQQNLVTHHTVAAAVSIIHILRRVYQEHYEVICL